MYNPLKIIPFLLLNINLILGQTSCPIGCDSVLSGTIVGNNLSTGSQTWCLDGVWVGLQNIQPNSTLISCHNSVIQTNQINNNGVIRNYGVMQITNSFNINGNGTLENFNVIKVSNNLNVNGDFLNNGSVNVSNNLIVNGNGYLYTTGSNLPIGYSLFHISNQFIVNGEVNSLTNCFVFDVAGQSVLNGGGDFIDSEICDNSASPQLFDIQNGNVSGSVGCNPSPHSCSTGSPLVYKPREDSTETDTIKTEKPILLKEYNIVGQHYTNEPIKISLFLLDKKLIIRKEYVY